MYYKDLLSRFTEISKNIFKDNLIGVYLHGSAAMGCFNPAKSDLDIILIVEKDVSDSVKIEFMKEAVKLNDGAPPKGMEFSVVKREFCKPFVYPTPYELHFSNAHLALFKENIQRYVEKLRGVDKDLAAHFTIINKYGIVLYGEEKDKVFAEVPREYYLDAIWYDIENARHDITENPIYITLNLCRVLAYLRENLILSKRAGGEWGCVSLPSDFHDFIQSVLKNYNSDENVEIDLETAQKFAEYMILQIRNERITMRRSDREIKDVNDIVKVMEKCDVCRLALNGGEYPYIVPLNFGMCFEAGIITLYFHCANEGKKCDLILKDNHVCFEMDCSHRLVTDMENGTCTMEYESVIGKGRIEIVPEEEKYRGLCILMEHYHKKDFPFNKAIMPATTVMKLVVEEITGKRRMKN